MIVFVDSGRLDQQLLELWELSGFPKRLSQLGGHLVFVGGDEIRRHVGSEMEWVDSPSEWFSSNPEALNQHDIGIFLEASQIFFDPSIVLSGLRKCRERSADYFTQWEHVKLPIGLGARYVKLNRWVAEGVPDQTDYILKIIENPEKFSIQYDEEVYAANTIAMLDSRWYSTRNQPVLDNSVDSWDLRGFHRLIESIGDQNFRHLPEQSISIRFTDERGVAAAFGFETQHCANFPSYIMFDLTNLCNARCIHCPQSMDFLGKEKTSFLSLDAFRSAINQCRGQKIDFIRITADGEPTLHPNFWEMIEYACESRLAPVGVTSNGSALNPKNAERLLASDLFMIDISIDAASKETFERVRAGLSYERVIRNVETLLQFREQMRSELKVVVSFVQQKENQHEVEDFETYWEGKVDEVLIREMHTNVGANDNVGSSEVGLNTRWPCPHLWRRVVINHDQRLKACPIDWDGRLLNEDIKVRDIGGQWHGDFYHDYRMQHLNNAHALESVCRTCTDWEATPWNLGYEKMISRLQRKTQ